MEIQNLIQQTLTFYDAGKLQTYIRLKHGFANENYKIVTDRGAYLFRIHLQQSPENIEKEHRMLEVLKKERFPAAFPVTDKAGRTWHQVDGRLVSLSDFVEGKIPELTPETVAETARVLAWLHAVDITGVPPKTNSTRPEKVANLVKRFPTASNLLPEIYQLFSEIWKEVAPFLREKLPTGLIHSDLFPDNTLFEGNRLKAVLDFEEYSIDTLLFDVAMCINGFCFVNNRLHPSLLEVFLQTYEQKRLLTASEKRLLPVYIRWASLAMASWHLRYHLMFRPDERQEKRVRELMHRAEMPVQPLF
jgi:homoserine kinase type II